VIVVLRGRHLTPTWKPRP